MAGSATDYLETQVLQHTLGIAAMAMPGAIYMALCTSASSDSVPGTEVVGGGYVRMRATFAMMGGFNNQAANAATIEWPQATAPWGTVGWAELWDAASGGNRLYWGPLVDPADGVTPINRVVQQYDIMRVPAGSYVVTCD